MIPTDKLRKAIANPKLALEYTKNRIVFGPRLLGRNNTGESVLLKEWDNLIILDACRYDTFKKINHLDGNLQPAFSLGSNTQEFLEKEFGREEFPEIVYVSANAQLTKVEGRFHDRIRVWEDNWNKEYDTVLPEAVVDAALDAYSKYPNKRLIVHFMQPHYPFIGETGEKLEEKGQFGDSNETERIWTQLQENKVSKYTVKQAYEENLEIVLPHAKRLADRLDGKSVITSDHGNEFGKWRIYGHPGGTYTTGLRKVPWFVFPEDRRRKIQPGYASVGPADKKAAVDAKLEALGYK